MTFSPTKVPIYISPELKSVCYKVAGTEQAEFVEIITSEKYKSNKCAYNAKLEAESVGGLVVFGWAVFVWDKVVYDFIGHAVVQKGDNLYCVTPSKMGEDRILFVRDSSITFDYDNPDSRLPLKEVAISKRPEVKELLRLREKIRDIKIKYPVANGAMIVSREDGLSISELEKRQSILVDRVNYQFYPVKESCPCGSRRQFRKCCRPYIKRSLG